MNNTARILIVVVLIVAVAVVIIIKQVKPPAKDRDIEIYPDANLPRVVDIGAGTCTACKMMTPVLDRLRTGYAGRLRVEYYDIRDDPNVITEYSVMIIPTQILYDASGKELFRNEGFLSEEDIVKKFEEFGLELAGPK